MKKFLLLLAALGLLVGSVTGCTTPADDDDDSSADDDDSAM